MPDAPGSAAVLARRVTTATIRLFHAYANWLIGISWKRFLLLSLLLLILAAVLQKVPPLSWTYDEDVEEARPLDVPKRPASPVRPGGGQAAPTARGDAQAGHDDADDDDADTDADDDATISIDRNGVRVTPNTAGRAASAAPAASSSASDPARGTARSIEIPLPGATREAVREAASAARKIVKEASRDARQQADEARREARAARHDAAEAHRDAAAATAEAERYRRVHVVHLVTSLPELAFLFIVASAILKASYKARVQAEVKAAVATETAESEQLKRQVVEARMAAMQAQVEPHFLFNTLASIDHLIETDPPRASQMQKNLIALLRASMPTLRDANPNAHTLGREMAMIRPYLEILKVRMEDRLQAEIGVPDGLLSAEFPSMMIQSLVENAIKHGLEPKPEGGTLSVRAEIVHGQLVVSVADTGLGFGRAATAGTGTGLTNIRERLQLLYGSRATLAVAANSPSGTRVTLTLPYQAHPVAAEGADR